jgi:hypothetical protein
MTRIPAKLLPGATIMADDNIHKIPIKNLISEPGAHELASSPEMKPYIPASQPDPLAEHLLYC